MPTDRPNLLLITTDQQRFDTTGPEAPEFLRTPHYDYLRRQGIRFSAAYSSCPVCVPSRVSIMTGNSVFTHGMTSNGSTDAVMGRAKTLPAYLGEAGYQTVGIGKMHFSPLRNRHGFDETVLPRDYFAARRCSGGQPMHHGLGQNELHPTRSTVHETESITSWIAGECVEFIRERRDPTVPFFLWCSFTKPHPPLDPPEPYYSMYRRCDIPEPVQGDWSRPDKLPPAIQRRAWAMFPPDSDEIIQEARAAYYGLITQVDYSVGRIFATLSEEGLLDNTLILYTSDHGEYLGDHGLANKLHFHESAAHVPFVLRLPTAWDDRCAGTTVEHPVQLADILPSMLAAAGEDPPGGIDGHDLLSIARGEGEPRQYVAAMAAAHSECDYLGITDGHRKYIWYPEGEHEHLFDLAVDPLECENRADEDEETVRELRRALVDCLERHDSPFVEDGDLVSVPVDGDEDFSATGEATTWEGFATDRSDTLH